MSKILILIIVALSFAAPVDAASRTFLQHGKASWYHKPQRTASGGRFDASGMTAAHRSLPFGTLVRVTHVRSKRSTVVRINDRGPYGKGRIIDLSKAAARELQMLQAGTAMVTLEIVKSPKG